MTTRPKTDDDEHVEDEEVEDEEVEDETDDDDDGDEEQEDESSESPFDVDEFIERVVEATESKIDSRISNLTKSLVKNYGLEKKGKSKSDDGPSGPDPSLTRALRAAARDAVANEFDDKDERKLALSLVKPMVDVRGLAIEEDEDEVAAALVSSVKEVLEGARDHYEAALRADLKRRGIITDDDPGQPRKPKGKGEDKGPSMTEQFRKGRQLATERYGKGE